jgi:dolichyl-diphosphooligosaccharide--protein glycosyltransferase
MGTFNLKTISLQESQWVKLFVPLVVLLFMVFTARSWVAYDYVFAKPNEVRLLGVDSYFHLRHAQYTVSNYPKIQRQDHNTHYPQGKGNDASGLFGLSIATIALLIHGSDASLSEISAIAAWFTPFLGLLAYLLLYVLSRQLIGHYAGVISVVAFLLYPGDALDRSILGFADHHVAEYCLALAITIGIVNLLRNSHLNKQQWYKPAFINALPLILLVYTWKGAIVFMPIIGISFLLYSTIALLNGVNTNKLICAIVRYCAAVIIALVCINFIFPGLVIFPFTMKWLILGFATLVISSSIYLFALSNFSKRFKPRLVHITGLVVVLVAIIAFFKWTAFGNKIINIFLGNSKIIVQEEYPLNFDVFFNQFGSVGILALLGGGFALWMLWKKSLAIETLIPLTIGGCWLILWWVTNDYSYFPPSFLAFSAMIPLYSLFLSIKKKQLKSWQTNLVVLSILILLILPIYPLKKSVTPWVDQNRLASGIIYKDDWFKAVDWLSKHSPQPTPMAQVNKQQENYGVMVSWDFGNLVASHGKRIPIWSRYPSSRVPKWALAQTEKESLKFLCSRCSKDQSTRYAIVDSNTYGPFSLIKSQYSKHKLTVKQNGKFDVNGTSIPRISYGKTYNNSMISKLYAKDGIELSHYRLIYESKELHYNAVFLQSLQKGTNVKYSFSLKALPIKTPEALVEYKEWVSADIVNTKDGYLYDDHIQSSIKIYEIVKGYPITGNTAPGAVVQARLDLHSKITGRKFQYVRSTTADENGHYQLTVPYATSTSPDEASIFASQPYQIFTRFDNKANYIFDQEVEITDLPFKNRAVSLIDNTLKKNE